MLDLRRIVLLPNNHLALRLLCQRFVQIFNIFLELKLDQLFSISIGFLQIEIIKLLLEVHKDLEIYQLFIKYHYIF